jgi:hypothetical protein
MSLHDKSTARPPSAGAPRCQCGGVITRATSRGFICETCWRDDSLYAERVAEIVKHFVRDYGAREGGAYADQLSDHFDAVADSVQARDHRVASALLKARAERER